MSLALGSRALTLIETGAWPLQKSSSPLQMFPGRVIETQCLCMPCDNNSEALRPVPVLRGRSGCSQKLRSLKLPLPRSPSL